jgi:hypothetical protein
MALTHEMDLNEQNVASIAKVTSTLRAITVHLVKEVILLYNKLAF